MISLQRLNCKAAPATGIAASLFLFPQTKCLPLGVVEAGMGTSMVQTAPFPVGNWGSPRPRMPARKQNTFLFSVWWPSSATDANGVHFPLGILTLGDPNWAFTRKRCHRCACCHCLPNPQMWEFCFAGNRDWGSSKDISNEHNGFTLCNPIAHESPRLCEQACVCHYFTCELFRRFSVFMLQGLSVPNICIYCHKLLRRRGNINITLSIDLYALCVLTIHRNCSNNTGSHCPSQQSRS